MSFFKLTSEQCELLMTLETLGSIKEVAKALRRDESVISRQMKQLASIAPVLEKSQKRWRVSELGREVTQWSREALESQNRVLSQRSSLRIATTREFSAKILCPNLHSLLDGERVSVSIYTSDDGIESELLSGKADVGIDCGRPEDPLVQFKTVIPEPYVVVATPTFLKQHSVKSKDDLLHLPHLKFNRDPALGLMELDFDIPYVFASFNDLGSVRSACCAGLGWATLPKYCISTELETNMLKEIHGWKLQSRSFGVWWVRGRQTSPWIKRTIEWLKKQSV
jgi:DNA-binding transcriptional LysR family regulator